MAQHVAQHMAQHVFNVIDVNAHHDGDGWYWDRWHQLEHGLVLSDDDLTPRRLLRLLRDKGYLTPQSKGRLTVDNSVDECIEVRAHRTGEPLLALSQLHGDELTLA